MQNNKSGKQIVKASLGYTIGNYLLKGLAFFSIPIFSRLMSTADYGIYNTFIAYASIAFPIIGLALHASFKNAKYKYSENLDNYISTCVAIGVISFIIWILLINVFYFAFDNIIGFSRSIVNMLIVYSMGSALVQYYNVYFSIDYRYDKFVKISAFNAISSILLSLLLMKTVFKDNAYVGRIIGTTIPLMIIGVFIVLFFLRRAKPKINKSYINFALKFSLPIIPHGISQVILSQFDRIMIKSIVGATEAGLYSFSYNIYTIIQVTASSLDNIWSTWFFKVATEKRYDEIKKASSEYVLGMLSFSSFILLISPELIMILSPESYWGSIHTVVPIVIAGFFSFLYSLPVQVEYYYEKTNAIAIGTSSAALINIILNAIFIPKYGYVAAAYTTLVTYLVYFIFHYEIAKYCGKRNYFDGKIQLISIFAILGIGIICLLFQRHFVVRWIIAFSIVAATIMFAQKRHQLIDRIKSFIIYKKGG